MPHLLDIQVRAFESLLQLDAAAHDREDVGLERVFKDLFPITDVHENFSLDFIRYTLGEPKYSVEECIERDMTYSAPLKATLTLDGLRGERRRRQEADQEPDREGGLPRRAAAAHAARHLRHQRRRARDREPAAPLARRGVRGVDAPQRPAPDLVAHHPVPRLVGRVHRRHPRRDLRPHRQEEEVPRHRAPARVRLREQPGHPPALLRRARARPHQEARGPRREPRGHRRDHRREHRAAGRGHGGRRPEGRRPRRRAPSASAARRSCSSKEGDELTEEVFNRLRRQNVDVVKVFASYGAVDLRDELDAIERGERAHARVLAVDAVDPETGEVIGETGQALKEMLVKRLRKHGLHKAYCFVPSGRAESTLIKNTLAQGPDQERGRGAQADLRAAAPGRRAEQGDGQAGDRAAVLLAEALRPRPRRPLQDQPAPGPHDRPRARRCSRRRTSSPSCATSWNCTRAAATWTTSTTWATAASARWAS